jgi:signal transduction histidine kinase/CheY-like chemotaxis protein/integral membrane sensor domain MASE1
MSVQWRMNTGIRTSAFYLLLRRWRQPLLDYSALTLSYALSGKLGLLLAVPPGYATAIFPPAGIAIAAMLIGGPATLPWTFLGSLLLSLWLGVRGETGGAVALVIAASATAQAGIAGGVLRRAIGYPTRLDRGRQMARLLLLSPICCLTSATLALSGLAALGVLKAQDFASSWVTWWVGDTLGVLLLLPLVLVIAGEPRALWRSRTSSVALPMLLFFALFAAIFGLVSRWEHDAALLEFRILSQHLVDKLRTGLDEQDVFLEQLQQSFSGPAPLSRADFRNLVGDFRRRFPTVQAIEWAPRVGGAERTRFEAAQQAELPGFAIREIGPSGKPRIARERPVYYPVTYVEPYSGNQRAVGFDLASNPDRAAAIARAEANPGVAATAPIRLVQETGNEAGMLLLRAVRGGPNGPGLVLVVLRIGDFMRGFTAPVRSELDVRLADMSRHEALYADMPQGLAGPSFAREFDFGGHRFMLRTAPTAAYVAQHRMWQSWAVLVAGAFSTSLLGALLLLGTGYARRIETEVQERTRDLETVNSRLQDEIRERQQAEAALRQAQRMEAMGQLTGGIAHDFNNLLMVMTGNIELVQAAAKLDTVTSDRLAAVRAAAERGAVLTNRLLAFARRQPLAPRVVDLNSVVAGMHDLLESALGGQVRVEAKLAADLWPAMVDPTQIELVILNLVINARDAMPEGGEVVIETQNRHGGPPARPEEPAEGDYVVVSVRDTGTGMPPEVQARAFEPFFTTKPPGAGTGLGLSQVFGTARQSGGDVQIDSAPGAGTTVSVFLPRTSAAVDAAAMPAAERAAPQASHAVVLAVDDDEAVRSTTAAILKDLGYGVVEAASGEAALDMLSRENGIDVLLTDVVMPGISGVELARKARAVAPHLPIVFISGFADPAGTIGSPPLRRLVKKPFRRLDLREQIEAALAEQHTRTPAPVPTETSCS